MTANDMPERIYATIEEERVYTDTPGKVFVSGRWNSVAGEGNYLRIDLVPTPRDSDISAAIETTHRAEIARLEARVKLLERVAEAARELREAIGLTDELRIAYAMSAYDIAEKALAALGAG